MQKSLNRSSIRCAAIVERVLFELVVMLMGVDEVIVFFDFLKPRVRRESFLRNFLYI